MLALHGGKCDTHATMADELSPREVAARLGTSSRSVQRWIANGRLPARRIGGRWRVASDALDAFAAPQVDGIVAMSLTTSIRTVFIANRGEIARRITGTCDRLGIRAVIPVTDGPNGLDLLDPAAVVAAALGAGADALHPGFGFLAENAAFAEAVEAAGIRWVGPPSSAIRAMGDKSAARRLADSLGIPVLPGYDGPRQTDRILARAAGGIGYPIIVKPAAGGGGKGMRTVREPGRLLEALAAARREAIAAFGDGRLILERLVEGGRHVEIQVLFDGHGHGVHLGERDCSIQRRHQKVLEESPSPAVDADLRHRLGVAALRLARTVGYVNAGTCEFLIDDRGVPAFLEMNARLQVEHPVTELVTGRDLVADQLRIAAGDMLGFDSGTVHSVGHAVEVRLYAEDAEAGFLPATGRVERLRWPSGEGIRVDAGIEQGTEIGDRFDPMLAKIVAWGPDRATAFERLAGALDATVVLGVVTNLRFLRWLVRQPVVRAGEARTDTLDRIWPPDDWSARVEIQDAAWRSAAAAFAAVGEPADPWAGGWRLNAAPTLTLAADGQVRSVRADVPPTTATDSDAYEAVLVGDTVHVDLGGRSTAFRIAPPPDVDATARAAAAHGHAGASGPVELVAPMPGAVLRVHATVGGVVAAGDPVVTLEAMKMEHVVVTSITGRIADLHVRAADQVTRGQLLAVVEP
jgi:acetyl-CoA/propionyl-CoA carboxylase, biotin carboxylase, biotin carboxyl carrier protein